MTADHDKDILIINGRRYSARTGKPLDGRRPSIDGLAHSRPKTHIAATLENRPAHKAEHKKHALEARHLHTRHKSGSSVHGTKQHIQNISAPAVQAQAAIAAHPSTANKVTSDRLQRARHISQSRQISKFGNFGSVPARSVAEPSASQIPIPETEPIFEQHRREHIEPPAPQLENRAMSTQAHHEAKIKKERFKRLVKKPRAFSMAAAALSVLLISGYMLYLNVPNMAFKVAASRSGIEAKIPDFKPNGFKFAGPINYSPGSIVISFKSTNGDERKYDVAQRKSDWDSESLLENYVSRQSEHYSAIENRGLTIYVWGGSNAAWVNKGIWYAIEGDSLLGTDQLLKIAASL